MTSIAIKKFNFPDLSNSQELSSDEINSMPEAAGIDNILSSYTSIAPEIDLPVNKIISEPNIDKIKDDAFKKGYNEAKELLTQQKENDGDLTKLFANINSSIKSIQLDFAEQCSDLSHDIVKTINLVITKLTTSNNLLIEGDLENFITSSVSKLSNINEINVFLNETNINMIEKFFSNSQTCINNKIQLKVDNNLDISSCRIEHKFGFLEIEKNKLVKEIKVALQTALMKHNNDKTVK